MISFSEVEKGKINEAAAAVTASGAPTEITERIADLIGEYEDMIDENLDTGVAVCTLCDCLLVRLFDMGRYLFVFPMPLTESADPMVALDGMRAYAVKEELSMNVVDLPAEYIGDTVRLFSHTDVSAADPDHEVFIIRAISECEAVEEIPTVTEGGLKLLGIAESDIADYAALCRDEDVNKFWGYDYKDEINDPADSYFYNEQIAELERASAVTFAVKWRETFIGEAVIFHFDLKGGAEIGFRLNKNYHGRGLGARTLKLIFRAAGEIGLSYLTASVMRENIASVRLLEKQMELISEDEKTLTYGVRL